MTGDWWFEILGNSIKENLDSFFHLAVAMNISTTVGDSAKAVQPQHATIGDAIRLHAATQPDHPAIVSTGLRPLTYRELQTLIDETRVALRAASLGRDARIAVAMPDNINAALAIVAVSCAAVSIPVNPKQTLSEVEASFVKLKPAAVVLAGNDSSTARTAAERLGITIIEATIERTRIGMRIGAGQASSERNASLADGPDPESTAFILQTSGSAAEPKLIPFSHRNMLAAAARNQSWFKLTTQDRCLSASPPFYSHGLKVTVLTPLLSGGTVVFPADGSRFSFSEWFEDLKPTWYSAGPTLHRMVLDQVRTEANAAKRHALRFILSGGAPLPQNVLEGLRDTLDVPVVEHYGSSEAAQIAANLPPPGPAKQGTCGVPWSGIVRIVDENGVDLAPGQQGEVLVGGPTLISGYLDAPELNRASFSNGWFRTGDLGSIDEDGFLTLHGRFSEVINRGGEKISPLEIDDALMRHPAVAEALAFPVPHPRLGQDVAAAVVLRPGMAATPVELRRYLQDQVASFKVPRRIVMCDQLPKGTSGKVVRRQMAAWLETNEQAAAAKSESSTPVSTKTDDVDPMLAGQLVTIWERLLQTAPVALDDDFFDKGGDSLLAVEMLAEVERLTGQSIPPSALFEARTIRQIAQKLSAKIARADVVTKLNPSGTSTPLIHFHGDHKGGFYVSRLATLLGPDQPLFVIDPHDLGKERSPLPVSTLAADRLRLIRETQPHGPYRLSGYCAESLVAFEVARALKAEGETVEFVAMIDPPTVNARRYLQFILLTLRLARPIARTTVDRLGGIIWYKFSMLDRPWKFSIKQRVEAIKQKVRRLSGSEESRAPVEKGRGPGETRLPTLTESRLVQFFNMDTTEWPPGVEEMAFYSPKPLAVPVLYFAADYGPSAWRRITTDITTVELSGNHFDAIKDAENLARISDSLKARLRR